MRTCMLLIAVLATSTAAADPPRYTRKQHVEVPVQLSHRVRPIDKHAASAATPAFTADDLMAVQDRQRPIREEQASLLLRLIADTPDDDPEKPDYMFRLAEHYAQQLRDWRLKAIEATMPAPPR
jgi:hypothetical protein